MLKVLFVKVSKQSINFCDVHSLMSKAVIPRKIFCIGPRVLWKDSHFEVVIVGIRSLVHDITFSTS